MAAQPAPSQALSAPRPVAGQVIAVLATTLALLVALRVRSGGIVVAFVVLFAIFVPAERILAARPQRVFRRQFWSDGVHFSVNTVLSNLGVLVVVVAVAVVFHAAPSARLQDAVAAQPAWRQFLEALAVSEICGYWAHRASHRVPLLWRFHRVHHSIEEMDWLAAARLHPVDQVFQRSCAILPLYILGFGRASFGALLALLTFQAIFIHANVRINVGPLRWLIATPQFHHWHHANQPEAIDHNFAGEFPVLDWVFGTLHLPGRTMPARYGIDEPLPQTWAAQMLSPLRRAA